MTHSNGFLSPADHRGVSNAQLAVEDEKLADKYHNKSIAEQHSLDISWELFMQPQFEDLRSCMFATEADLKRFRQVLVNVVLATGKILTAKSENCTLSKAKWILSPSLFDQISSTAS